MRRERTRARARATGAAEKGLSFKNAFYALAIHGSGPRLRVLGETAKHVRLSVECATPRVVVAEADTVARYSCS